LPGADRESLLRYYRQELTYLREMGAVFAHRHPKVARRLELGPDESADPHVERLLEAFALLTGRIQQNLDADYPEIAAELLNVLYPHYLNPIPPMTIARFETDPKRGYPTAGQLVPRHTALFSQHDEGVICRFRTAYPIHLWPLEVTAARFENPIRYEGTGLPEAATVLALRIDSRQGSLQDLELDRLRFFLHGDSLLVNTLYELIFAHCLGVAAAGDRDRAPHLLTDRWGEARKPLEVGFGLDEETLPYPYHAHPAYRLVQEYFVFPEKFHFFEVDGLELLRERGAGEEHFELLLLFDTLPESRLSVTPDTFRLGCTPAVNLFRRTSEPIRLDRTRLEYRLIPDYHRERTTEVHSIESVSASSDREDGSRELAPFYGFTHDLEERDHGAFWHARRVPTRLQEVTGTDILLSFVDLDYHPAWPSTDTVYAHVLCTNRLLASQIDAGGALQADLAGLSVPIAALLKPTPRLSPPMDGQTLWRLVSQLSLNYLSLSGSPRSPGDGESAVQATQSLEALKEILRLYSVLDAPATQRQIQGVREMAVRPVIRRFGEQAWTGFCRGREVSLTFDRAFYTGGSAFLLGAVLRRFFALQAPVNSFAEVVLHTTDRKGEWKRWPPMAGERPLP
jgi:type VI secretion system protein ImpG